MDSSDSGPGGGWRPPNESRAPAPSAPAPSRRGGRATTIGLVVALVLLGAVMVGVTAFLMAGTRELRTEIAAVSEERDALTDEVSAITSERDELDGQLKDVNAELDSCRNVVATGLELTASLDELLSIDVAWLRAPEGSEQRAELESAAEEIALEIGRLASALEAQATLCPEPSEAPEV
jgi:hypothetical protein